MASTHSATLSPRKVGAFTLVELLVVVAIIAVLVSLLMPVFMRVREAAVTLRCVANLRQVGIALNSYATDNRGIIPNPGWYTHYTLGSNPAAPASTITTGQQWWYDLLLGKYPHAQVYIKPAAGGAIPDILFCPNNGFMKRSPGTYSMYGFTNEEAYFKEPVKPVTAYPGTVTFEGERLALIKNPGDMFIVGCSTLSSGSTQIGSSTGWVSFASHAVATTGGGAVNTLWANHHDRVNGLFADFHVETCDAARLFSCSNRNGNKVSAGYPSDRTFGITCWESEDLTHWCQY